MKERFLMILGFVSLILSLAMTAGAGEVRTGCCSEGAQAVQRIQASLSSSSAAETAGAQTAIRGSSLVEQNASEACGETVPAEAHLGCCGGCDCSHTTTDEPQSDLPPNAPTVSRAPIAAATWVAAGFEIFRRDLLALSTRERVRSRAACKPHGIAPSLRVLHCAFQI